jgi:hypothetical protein
MEVIDTDIEYNLLHGSTWFYEMTAIVSSIFRVICFPHQGKIVTIDQLMFYTLDLGSIVGSNVPFVSDIVRKMEHFHAKPNRGEEEVFNL